jgi:MFS family permease
LQLDAAVNSTAFRWLWISQTVSLLGSQVGTLALALLAVLAVHRGPVAVGLVIAARYAPFVVLAVPAGALVDRLPHHLVMMASDIARALVVGTVVVAAFTTGIGMPALLIASALAGLFQVMFDTACQAYLLSLVTRDGLSHANRWMQGSQSFADLGGPAFGGALVGSMGPAAALAIDACSFVFSAICLVRSKLPAPAQALAVPESRNVEVPSSASDPLEGVRYVMRSGSLRALVAEAGTFNLLDQGLLPVFLVYSQTVLHLGPTGFGLVLTAGGLGTLAGAIGSGFATSRWGFGRLLVVTGFGGCAAYLVIPAVDVSPGVDTAAIAIGMFCSGVATGVANVQAVTLRQLLTPRPLLGRVTAAFRAAAFGAIPLGACGGGLLAAWLGLRPALWVLAAALLTTPLWLVFSPIRSVVSLGEISCEA